MAYRVQAGSLTIVVRSPQEALRLHDTFVEDGGSDTFISDMNGSPLNLERLRDEVRENEDQ